MSSHCVTLKMKSKQPALLLGSVRNAAHASVAARGAGPARLTRICTCAAGPEAEGFALLLQSLPEDAVVGDDILLAVFDFRHVDNLNLTETPHSSGAGWVLRATSLKAGAQTWRPGDAGTRTRRKGWESARALGVGARRGSGRTAVCRLKNLLAVDQFLNCCWVPSDTRDADAAVQL